MEDYESMARILWNFALGIINFAGSVWSYLVTPTTLAWGPVIVELGAPLYIFGGGIIFVLLGLFLVKTFIPLA